MKYCESPGEVHCISYGYAPRGPSPDHDASFFDQMPNPGSHRKWLSE